MPRTTRQTPLFSLGQVFATRGAAALDVDFSIFIARHSRGDWGRVDEHGQSANVEAVRSGGRIVSSYSVIHRAGNAVIWIITEADRSRTTVLLPEEY